MNYFYYLMSAFFFFLFIYLLNKKWKELKIKKKIVRTPSLITELKSDEQILYYDKPNIEYNNIRIGNVQIQETSIHNGFPFSKERNAEVRYYA